MQAPRKPNDGGRRTNWPQLLEATVFVDPELVSDLHQALGTTVVMPLAFRGTVREFAEKGATHNNGFPVLQDGIAYALWGMRPSREVSSLALGLARKGLESQRTRNLAGRHHSWTPHHVHQCGIRGQPVAVRVELFTSLANLVLMDDGFHVQESQSVHAGEFGQWLAWAIQQLYGMAAPSSAAPLDRPPGSPSVSDVSILDLSSDHRAAALSALCQLNENQPAGSQKATEGVRALSAAITRRAP